MLESEYKELVLTDYDEKVKHKLLPSELLLPSPANIKAELVKLCAQGISANDEKILRSFVGPKPDMTAYRNALSNGKADPFRPLVNLLRDRSIDTNQRNIDLLALLIDFKPRPFHFTLVIPPKTTPPTEGPIEPPPSPFPPIITAPPPKGKRKWISLISLLIIIAGIATYLYIRPQSKHYTGHEGCMIWSDDHYEPTACSDHSSGKLLYPINHELVDHFKKITDPQTLTPASVGKVWYAKYNGNVEFFTDSGPYPLDTNRRVLPMSMHILQKYVYHVTN